MQVWQMPLVLPTAYLDLRRQSILQPIETLHERGGTAIAARIATPPTWTSAPPPRGDCQGLDVTGERFRISIFGARWSFKDTLKPGQTVALVGKTREWNGRLSFTASHVLPSSAAGRILPLYPKTGRLAGAAVRKAMIDAFGEALEQSVRFIEEGLPPDWQRLLSINNPLDALLRQVHFPQSEQDTKALDALRRINQLYVIQRMAGQNKAPPSRDPLRIDEDSVRRRIAGAPFQLTRDQRQAIAEIIDDLRGERPMRRLLTGDVGTGKTICYLMAAAVAADAGCRTAVVLPNLVLAEQVYRECREIFPDLPAALVVAGNPGTTRNGPRDTAIVVGTTAILHEKSFKNAFDFAVFDEQQRFSRAQRQGKRTEADDDAVLPKTAHRLEVSATPIPASMSLLTLGYVATSRLREGHANKRITTRIWNADRRADLYREMRARIAAGDQVAVIYPLKRGTTEMSDAENRQVLRSAEDAAEKWQSLYPGRVRLLHGDMDDAEKSGVLEAMRERRADILVATTVIEVGVTIPGLRTMLVAGADRLGLSQLHQLRGRLARTGGEGWFHLLIDREATRERLSILEKTTDGFRIAEEDLRLRGMGDADADGAQSGKTYGFILPARKASRVEFREILDLSHRVEEARNRRGSRRPPPNTAGTAATRL